MIIIGFVSLITAVCSVVIAGVYDIPQARIRAGIVVGAIGTAIFGWLILQFGKKVRDGMNDKVAFVSGLMRVVGIATILGAIFAAVSSGLILGSIGAGIVSFVVAIIVGLIYLWIAEKIKGKDKNIISKFLWVLILVASPIVAIFYLIAFFGSIGSDPWVLMEGIRSLCWCPVYIFVFLAMLSPEIKQSMGI
ncbi:MAG: hypothetical protein FWH47_07730 [Methanomassiliicoccaceae archaeon]|nr:hypothetical protein [Methanomassiliicoccaceae archaeon]